jgi:hypothetical protein
MVAIQKNVVAAVLGVAMIASVAFALTAVRAHATSTSELVELLIASGVIPADKAAAARAAVASTPATPVAAANFTRNLKKGDTGADVKALQEFLNAKGYTVAVAGAGSKGMETMTYGPATAAAVSKFQEAYASEILAPLGLSKGTGNFGTATRAKANALASSTTGGTTDNGTTDGDTDTDSDKLTGGEANLKNFKRISDYSGEDIKDDTTDNAVYGFKFDVEDADVKVSRVDLRFYSAGTVTDPWKAFDTISLYAGDKKVADVDAGSKSDWTKKSSGNGYEIRLSGVDTIVKEGDTAEFTVKVDVKNIDDSDLSSADWSVYIPANGIRATDAAGVEQYIGDSDTLSGASADETFTIEAIGADTEMRLATASANPKASTIVVDDNNTTKDVDVMVGTIEARNGEITVNKVVVFATTSDTDLTDVINDVALTIDGNTYTDWYYADTATGAEVADPNESGYIVFDLADSDDEITIDEGDKVDMTLTVDFKKLSGNYTSGATVQFDVDETSRSAWEVDDAAGDAIGTSSDKGTINGEEHKVASTGLLATIVSTTATKTAGDNNANDVGDYRVKFALEAVNDTYFVSATTTAVITYHVEDGAGTTVSTTTTAALTSTAEKEGNAYRVDDGSSEDFTLTVTLNPQTSGYYKVEVDSITYGSDYATPFGSSHTATPDTDFETDVLYLNA